MLVLDVFVGVPNAQGKEIFVQPETAGAHSGDDILWRVFSLDPDGQHVEIDFEDPADEFFPSHSTGTRSKWYSAASGAAAAKQGDIHGDAPRPGGSRPPSHPSTGSGLRRGSDEGRQDAGRTRPHHRDGRSLGATDLAPRRAPGRAVGRGMSTA